MPETEWMTLLETADLMKTLPSKVAKMCEDGKLEYYKENDQYFVSRESIDLFMLPQTSELTGRIDNNNTETDNPVDQESANMEDSEAEVEYLPNAFTNVPLEDASPTANKFTNLIEGTNGIPRRKYGKPSGELDQPSKTSFESQTPERQEANSTLARERTDGPTEETPAVHRNFGENTDSVNEDKAVVRAESETQSRIDSSQEQIEESVASDDRADQEIVETAGDMDERDKSPSLEQATNTGKPERTYPERADAAPVDSTKDATGAPQDISTLIPDNSTREAMEVLVKLREAIAQQASSQKVFCDQVSSLMDTLENTLLSNENKTSELTREISSLLARYTSR